MTLPLPLVAHAAFWCAFTVTLLASRRGPARPPPSVAPPVSSPVSAKLSRTLVAVHAVGFLVMYRGVGHVLATRPAAATALDLRAALGLASIALAGALACLALVHFRSWRLRATLDAGHELATGGPFRRVRHPIYAALDLFALGTAVWLPAPLTWLGAVLVVLGGDLRARAEERVLLQAFGPAYAAYCARTKRLLPGVY